MRKFIYPFAMMAGLIIASSCTENEGVRMRELRTRSISTAASASDNTGNPNATPDANRPSPDTRMAYEDNNEAGMALSWQPTDAFKGFYTTPHVQEVVGQETSALFTYSEASATGDNAHAQFTGNVAEDVDANTSFNLFYPAARSTGNTWQEAQASLTGQVQNGNNSTAHLSAYDYMRATGITGIESSLVPFEHLLAIMRFDLTLEGYDPKADGEPCLFLLHYEGENPFRLHRRRHRRQPDEKPECRIGEHRNPLASHGNPACQWAARLLHDGSHHLAGRRTYCHCGLPKRHALREDANALL